MEFFFTALPEFCSFVLQILLKFYQDLNSIDEVGQLDDHFEDLNSINEVRQLEDQTEFLCNVDEEYVPKVGMTFKSCTEASEFYKEYAKRAGFSSKIRNSQRNKETGAIKNQLFTCKRKGKRRSDILEAEKTNPMSPANCPARMFVHIDKLTQRYVISKVVLKHSHPFSADLAEMLPQHRELSMYVRHVIVNNDQAGI
ncbi:hypothetical protein PIB30_054634 [Stylosanthes scabra]|uniref:FAR1 domain-containing protein n=1 Tax=Stylosanthes scabra TaxID=79078 RepID=A0ABU6VKV1_9FABA|nr:hypothetical protein [Stylosanthes scabra]